MEKVAKDILKEAYPQRPAEVKKYDYGLLLVIGGGEFYSGAPALSGLAAFRAGADMVRVIAPKRAADIIASFTPVLAALPLDNTHLLKEHLATLIGRAESAKEVAHGNAAICIGGGLGRTEETLETVLEFLHQTSLPVVIDADALHAVAKDPTVLAGKPFVITPNTFEFELITGKEVRSLSEEERIPVVQEAARALQTTILLKVKTDIISNGTETLLNETGSPYLSIGGVGDTLAGITGALLARGLSPLKAAACAAYINGKAGELAAKEKGESLIATDLIDSIQEVLGK
ncbi:MAG: NAD(P)H-hydrate dehydratase [bacterium]|nr:NAD(P)H-hydrate dehydratase [bacterium]